MVNTPAAVALLICLIWAFSYVVECRREMPCKKSGYCSVGQVQGYVGDIASSRATTMSRLHPSSTPSLCVEIHTGRPMHSGTELIRALNRIGFKNEIIFTISEGYNPKYVMSTNQYDAGDQEPESSLTYIPSHSFPQFTDVQ